MMNHSLSRKALAGIAVMAAFASTTWATSAPGGPVNTENGSRTSRGLVVDCRYLWLPISPTAPSRWLNLTVGGEIVRQFTLRLTSGQPDSWVFTNVEEFRGRTLKIAGVSPVDGTALDAIRLADQRPPVDGLYDEPVRPQYHFSPQVGRLNDPHGLIYQDGEYHLYYQQSLFGVEGGNKSWGHAVSTDLLHWRELDTAIHPDRRGLIYSGWVVADHHNTAGFARAGGKLAPLIALYTSGGGTGSYPQGAGQPLTQSLAWSTDGGRNFIPYSGNPVLGFVHGSNRDPKVFWHEPTQRWVMLLFITRGRFQFYTSADLKQWTKRSELAMADGYECPDIFSLPVDGDPQKVRWVVWEAAGRYLLGDFDGEKFTADAGGPYQTRFDSNAYAAHTFEDFPDERVVQIAWIRHRNYPGTRFSQMMTVPRVLALRNTSEGIRLLVEPVKELEALRADGESRRDLKVGETPLPLPWLEDKSCDVEMEIELGTAQRVEINLFGGKIAYDATTGQLTALTARAPLQPVNGGITLRILVDRVSYEVFANGGRVELANCLPPELLATKAACSIQVFGGEATVKTLKTWRMRSIWKPRAAANPVRRHFAGPSPTRSTTA